MTLYEVIDLAKIILVFFYSVILHEYAHGWVAHRLGDPTAKMMGRLTLNPIKHVDPFGTVILPILLTVTHSPVFFGWAKPVPVNFLNFKDPKRDMMWVGIAGPIVNITLAVFFSLLLRFDLPMNEVRFISQAIIINLVLAVFNMIPIPPLDGSRLVMGLLPDSLCAPYSRLERYGIFIVLGLLYVGLFDHLVYPIVVSLAHLLGVT